MEFVSIQQRAFGIIAIGQEAEGVIAIGQIATGFVAIGQMATGVIAVGQLARGVFALGMVAIGLFPVGMVAVGVFAARALIGAAALGGKLAVFPLMPFPRIDPFGMKKADEVLSSGARGFVAGELRMGGDRVPKLYDKDGREVAAPIATELLDAARTRAAEAEGDRFVVAELVPLAGREHQIERLIAVPGAIVRGTGRYFVWAFAIAALVAIIVGFYLAVALPLLELVVHLARG